MPRLVDAEKLAKYKADCCCVSLTEWQQGWNDAIDTIIDEAPTVDAVEVVRCKDCKSYIPCQKLPIGTSKWCDLFDRATCEMNYCGWGERREDAD